MDQAKIRGKDLVGGVKVMPMGLDAAIKKRTSGEFKMEQKGGSMSFSEANQSSSINQESRQLATFQEESSESCGFTQTNNSVKTSSMKSSSTMNQSSSSSFQTSSRAHVESSNQSSSMSMSSSKTMTSSSSSFQSGCTKQENQISNVESKLIENQQQEIQQDNLKTQIVSAITDLEGDREFVDFGRENKTVELLTSPEQKLSPPRVTSFTPTKQDPFSPGKQELFSPPPLERFEPPQPQQPQEAQPATNGGTVGPQPQPAPTRNGLQNGFNGFVSSKNVEVEQIHEFSQRQTTEINGSYEESGSIQGSNSSNSILQKIMTPASAEYESGSLKRRDPKKMFTDSSFYNSKYHPTIADQVEMAHKLSSAMFTEQNQASKGAKMYLTRMENSGGFQDKETVPKHDTVPNMKLVMNPEGKVTDWDDLAPDQRPDYSQVAVHAAPSLSLPEVADPVAESLNAGVGKGETPFYRPSTFVSAYRQVFDQHRGVFGSQATLKSPETPRASKKQQTSAHLSQAESETKDIVTALQSVQAGQTTNNQIGKIIDNTLNTPNTPKTPPRKKAHFVGESKKSKLSDDSGLRAVNLKRHKSFNEEKFGVELRAEKFFMENQPDVNSFKPSDTLKTPFLLPTRSQPGPFNNFPQINSTSMVAKTKALFEEKDRTDFVPLGKSRTFSSFPTATESETPMSCPLTPSVPVRKSSRAVCETYKSMNCNINSCGIESTKASPLLERRIPMRNFF